MSLKTLYLDHKIKALRFEALAMLTGEVPMDEDRLASIRAELKRLNAPTS